MSFINLDKFKEKIPINIQIKIKKLKIPPNWENIHIADNFSSKIQAYGYDNKGKKQYIYHPLWKIFTSNIKFINNETFNINKLKLVINKHKTNTSLHKEYVISNMLQFMIDLNIRVGNEIYLYENDSIGLCTMQKKNYNRNKLIFKGKKGKMHEKLLNKSHINFINSIIHLKGDFLFKYKINNTIENVNASDLNDYLKKYIDSNITTKDIRTYQANKIFIETIKNKEHLFDDIKKLQKIALKETAEKLGNSPKICKDSYINPKNLII